MHTTEPEIGWSTPPSKAVHTTEPTCFVNKRYLRIAYIGNLNIYKSCKYTSHIQHTFFKQYASLTKLSMSWYCPLTLVGCLLFSFEMRHTTEPRCSVVCVYTARLCAGRLGGVEGHPWWWRSRIKMCVCVRKWYLRSSELHPNSMSSKISYEIFVL